MYKLLALDMDGTILTSQKTVSPATVKAINNLIKRGTAVTLCTGRGIAELKDYTDDFSAIPYGILNSGGNVYDFTKRQSIHRILLEDSSLIECIRAARKVKAMPYLLTEDASVAQAEDMRDVSRFQMGMYQSLYDRVATIVPDMETYVREHPGKSLKLCIFHRDSGTREQTRRAVKHLGMELADAETTSLEISPRGVTKGLGLKTLCSYLGISIEESVAVGDADNDIDVLNTAGLSVAMGNANKKVKDLCDVIVADNDHDGIVEVIDRFFR